MLKILGFDVDIFVHAFSLLVVVAQFGQTLGPRGLKPARLLCPWGSPGKNIGLGCHALLQGIFLTQGLNLCLLHWQADSLPLVHLGSSLLGLSKRSTSVYQQFLQEYSKKHCSQQKNNHYKNLEKMQGSTHSRTQIHCVICTVHCVICIVQCTQ